MIERIIKILEQPVCDNCLGRQFAQLLSGYSNAERGRILRTAVAMQIDTGVLQTGSVDINNFFNYKFRYNKDILKQSLKRKKCSVCDDFFEKIGRTVKKIESKLKGIDFDTFLVGTQISQTLLKKEELLWEKIGIDYCEPLRAEINREVGKKLENALKKRAELKKPDIVILLDLENNKIRLQINQLYVFGFYKKFARGIPQCRWGMPHHYKTSVEQIIGVPLQKAAQGKDYKLHGAGREDINARCLAWRPFVLEILKPKKRLLNFKSIEKTIKKSKKVEVKGLKAVDTSVVKKIKAARLDKVYECLVALNKPVAKSELKKLKGLAGIIHQRTPERVLHRRSDLLRRREVKSLKYKMLGKKTFKLIVHSTAGLYIKELISGDNGRTKPSVAELLGRKATCRQLDVIKIGKIEP